MHHVEKISVGVQGEFLFGVARVGKKAGCEMTPKTLQVLLIPLGRSAVGVKDKGAIGKKGEPFVLISSGWFSY